MKKHTDTQKETALDLAKRGVLVINSTAKDRILTRQVGILPPAFMNAVDGLAYDSLSASAFKPASWLRAKPKEDIGIMFFSAQVSERLTHLIPNCHPEPHPHY